MNDTNFRTDYIYSPEGDPHKERARYILKNYPQVKQWIKSYPLSALYIFFIVAFQITVAMWVSDKPWWIMLGIAFLVGSVASHSLFALMHDASHSLVFKNKLLTKLTLIFVNFGQGFPSGIPFMKYHLTHHIHFTDYDEDLDIPLKWEASMVTNHPIKKAFWLVLLPFIQIFRPMVRKVMVMDFWLVFNAIAVLLVDLLLGYLFGWQALVYILASTFFGTGFFHPLGARWIQEHFVFKDEQATYSYYGVANKFAFNIGYHNEHHDLMGIPWLYLPKLKKTAPEFYESLYSHTSWIKLYFRVIFDRRITLFDRIVKQKT